VAQHRHDLPVAMMCRLLDIKPSGFYAWLRRPESLRARANARLKKQIDSIYAESDGVYGSRKVATNC
jgi:putative transposase